MNNSNDKLYTKAEISRRLFSLLCLMGIPANLKGFRYLNDAVSEVYYNPEAGKRVVAGLYCFIAEKNNTVPQCVEHSVRTALARLNRPGNRDKYYEFVGGKMAYTAKKFINAVANKLREESMKEKV